MTEKEDLGPTASEGRFIQDAYGEAPAPPPLHLAFVAGLAQTVEKTSNLEPYFVQNGAMGIQNGRKFDPRRVVPRWLKEPPRGRKDAQEVPKRVP